MSFAFDRVTAAILVGWLMAMGLIVLVVL